MIRKLFFLFIFLFYALAIQADVLSSFVKGNEAYKEQNYEEAIRQYENILKEDQASAAIYFNLGNAYYRNGELGKAILNFKRAEQLNPRDSDIQFNLKYASRNVKRTIEKETNFFQNMAQRHIQFYSLDEMILIMTLSIFALGLVFLLSRFLKWPKNRRYFTRFICLVIFILFAAGVIIKLTLQKDLAIIIQRTPAYYEPSPDATEHFQLYEGGSVKILRKEGNWIKIKRADGLRGWIPKESAEKL